MIFFLLLHLHLPLLPLQLHLVWFIFSVCSCCFETETHLLSNLITFCSDFFPSIWPQKTKQKQQKKTFFFHWKWKIFPANFTVCCAIAFFLYFIVFVCCLFRELPSTCRTICVFNLMICTNYCVQCHHNTQTFIFLWPVYDGQQQKTLCMVGTTEYKCLVNQPVTKTKWKILLAVAFF